MAITLRNVTGSALTYDQLDTNFSSFFYSASISGLTLTLFTTGSTGLGGVPTPASMSVNISSISNWTSSASGISRSGSVTVEGSFANGTKGTEASGSYSLAQGGSARALGLASHAEGNSTTAYAPYSHTEGSGTSTYGTGSHAEGASTTAQGNYSHAEGAETYSTGERSHAEGYRTVAYGTGSHAEGYGSIASGSHAHAEGYGSTASGSYSHAEGKGTFAIGNYSHAEGETTTASGSHAHAEGLEVRAVGNYSHAEGYDTQTDGQASHAEGASTTASGSFSHAEGNGTYAIGNYSHAEGEGAETYGESSHAEGRNTTTIGDYSHAEGFGTTTQADYSHAEGLATVASGSYQHVQGQYNVSSSAQSAFIIGNGTADGSRSNLVFASGSQFQVTGSVYISNDLYVGGNKQYNYGAFYDTGSHTLAATTPYTQSFSSTYQTSGVSIAGAANTRITVANTGVYNISFSSQLSQTTADRVVDVWFKTNGTAIANSNTKASTRNGDYEVVAWNFVTTLNAGDYVELLYQSSGTGTTIPYVAGSGEVPATPSAILTVTQVR